MWLGLCFLTTKFIKVLYEAHQKISVVFYRCIFIEIGRKGRSSFLSFSIEKQNIFSLLLLNTLNRQK